MPSRTSPSPSRSPLSTRVSTERTVEALTWLRKFLTAESSASRAATLTSGIELSAKTIQSIEIVRGVVEKRVQDSQSSINGINEQTRCYCAHINALETAGARELLEHFDADAIAEVSPLCDIASELQLAPYQCLSRGAWVVTMSELVQKYLETEEWMEERKERLAEAQASLKEACELRGRAVKGLEEIEERVVGGREQGAKDAAKAERMEMKAEEYEAAAVEWRERVKRTGVSGWCRHEAVVRAGRELTQAETKLEEVNRALGRYEGLPTVRKRKHPFSFCTRRIRGKHLLVSDNFLLCCNLRGVHRIWKSVKRL